MLTDRVIKSAKPKDKQYKLSDGDGLYLWVNPRGTKSFYYRYKWNGKDSTITIGKYPLVSLVDARKKRDEFALSLLNGKNPKIEIGGGTTFSEIANEWFERKRGEWTEKTQQTNKKRLGYAVDAFGSMAINNISALDVLTMLRQIESRGTIETSKRVKKHCFSGL